MLQARNRFRFLHTFDVVVTTRARITVLGDTPEEARQRLIEGAWNTVIPNWDDPVTKPNSWEKLSETPR